MTRSLAGIVEREKGFEPSTSTLARWHSTTELLPQRLRTGDVAPSTLRVNSVFRERVARRIGAARLMLSEPRQHRDDRERSLLHHVLQEHDLELQRVLALVIELIGVRIERRALCDRVDRFDVCLHCAERSVERFA